MAGVVIVKVHVISPARLHLGIIDPAGALGRKYGSIGVTIDKPCVEVYAERFKKVEVVCKKDVEARPSEIKSYVNCILKNFNVKGGAKITVERDIPKHVGLGSTTQMALSVAAAVTKLYDKKAPIRALSALLGRGRISGIGTAAFEAGGFIVDGGIKSGKGPPRMAFRADFPDNWFFVIAVPHRQKGLGEKEEKKIFKEFPAHSGYAREISHLLNMKMIPALVDKDIKSFGAALTDIKVIVGKSFSMFQEGIYHSKVSEAFVRFFLRSGARGSGQSSWGPTVYGLVDGAKRGEELKHKVKEFIGKKGLEWSVYRVVANNRGALIKTD